MKWFLRFVLAVLLFALSESAVDAGGRRSFGSSRSFGGRSSRSSRSFSSFRFQSPFQRSFNLSSFYGSFPSYRFSSFSYPFSFSSRFYGTFPSYDFSSFDSLTRLRLLLALSDYGAASYSLPYSLTATYAAPSVSYSAPEFELPICGPGFSLPYGFGTSYPTLDSYLSIVPLRYQAVLRFYFSRGFYNQVALSTFFRNGTFFKGGSFRVRRGTRVQGGRVVRGRSGGRRSGLSSRSIRRATRSTGGRRSGRRSERSSTRIRTRTRSRR